MRLPNKHVCQEFFCLIFVALLLTNVLWFAMTVQPVLASPGLTLKWAVNLGRRAWTHIGPLAADLVGDDKMEIVVTGGDNNGTGAVTVLNGTDGTKLWQFNNTNIGTHSPFDIVDLNKDGIPEIVVSAWYPLVLHGNNGSLYWTNQACKAFQNYNAIFDIDGDGYPEVFVCSGSGPIAGHDYITRLSYNGSILDQAWSWHPCYGGLTIGDTNFDGRFELYQGDRSNSYSASGDPYKGGGLGVRALDAHTLTPLWNDPTILCSSQSPILADVNKDGILDVIVLMQTNNGIAVLNSADGSVVTTGGKYRKGRIEIHSSHSPPGVYDIDGDGNLELIDCNDSPVKIYDLYDWKLDATLPIEGNEPPRVGDVTGDGKMDIIAVTSGYNNDIYIYSYDDFTGNYIQVDHVGGLIEGNAYTLVQDVDGDGLNELIVTSMKGNVYCYDTPAPAPTPRVRSGLQFYSQYRCGAAEYVPPPTPSRPVLRDEQPRDSSLNQTLNPTLSIRATDFQKDSMDITFRTNTSGTWETIGQYTNVLNGVYNVTTTNMDEIGATYYWSVTATDSSSTTSANYSFTTYSTDPIQGNPNLVSSDGTNGSKENLICYNQTTADIDGDEVTNIYNWYVNDTSFNNLLLPFDTHTTNNPLVADELFNDGFEDGFGGWDFDNWALDTSQKHSGTYSAHAGGTSNDLISKDFDTSSAEAITVSFWYRDHGIDDGDNVYLQFWNGSTYNNIFELGNTRPEDTWHWYTVQTYDPRYLIEDFHTRFRAINGIDSGEDLWIDDLSVTVPSRTKDYSGYYNHGTIHGATWTNEGVVGGAYVFDGVNDFIRISDDPSLGGDATWPEISVEFWVEPAVPLHGTRIVAKKVPQASASSYMVGFQTWTGYPANTLFWGITSTSDGDWHEISDTSTTALETGKWHHVVVTYKSGPGLTIYIDGTERVNMPLTGNIAPGPGESIHKQPLFIGYDGGGDRRRWFKGALDEVRIYPKALSPFQIRQRYLETKDGLSNNSTVAWQETDVGEVWECQVTPNDGFGDGQSKLSNTLTVLHPPPGSNIPPVAENLTLMPLSPISTDTLICSYDYFDADGDPEYRTEIRWYKDGGLQTELNDWLSVPSSFTAKGEVWYFTVKPRDGAELGDLQTSPSVTILNSPPSFTDVYITPDPAFDTSTLTANPYEWFDYDNDPEGYVYQWQKLSGGIWQDIIGEPSQTLSPDYLTEETPSELTVLPSTVKTMGRHT